MWSTAPTPWASTASRQSTIAGNTIRNIALIGNLGAPAWAVARPAAKACTEDGDGIRIKVDNDGAYTGYNVILRHNRLERIGYNGLDLFGNSNTVEGNVIVHACISKGDCEALRSFGSGSLATTNVHDLAITNNIVVAPIGNTDGCR